MQKIQDRKQMAENMQKEQEAEAFLTGILNKSSSSSKE
jgi:hypothetical protein